MIDEHESEGTDMARRRRSRPPAKVLRERSEALMRQARELEEQAEAAEQEEKRPPRPEPVEVEIAQSTYQPSKAELEEDLRVNVSFEEALDALVMPVKIKRVPRPPQSR